MIRMIALGIICALAWFALCTSALAALSAWVIDRATLPLWAAYVVGFGLPAWIASAVTALMIFVHISGFKP